ncbi:MAG: hypothetical protein CMA79_03595, partial [Euryarchaeota archaeon]|nr:hypothetical protein [Euryarchaeota archaeon]
MKEAERKDAFLTSPMTSSGSTSNFLNSLHIDCCLSGSMPDSSRAQLMTENSRLPPILILSLLVFSIIAPSVTASGSILLSSDSYAEESSIGHPANYTITVENDGTTDLSVTLSLSQASTCSGYTSSLSTSTLTLLSGTSGTSTLSVSVNGTATGNCDTTVTATGSDSSGGSVTDSITVETTGNPSWPSGHTRFVYIRTDDSGANAQTPYTLEFSAPPMSDGSPYNMHQFCNDSNGDDDDVWEAFVPTDFNSVTSWSVVNVNGITLGQYVSYNLTDAEGGAMTYPMVTFEQNTSASGHVASTLSDSEYYACHSPPDDGDDDSDQYYDSSGMGIIEYDSQSPSSSQSCTSNYSSCPLNITLLEDGWTNVTIGAWGLGNHDTSLEVISWLNGVQTNSFTVSVNDSQHIAVTIPFLVEAGTCTVEIEANLNNDGNQTSWSQSWGDMCDALPEPEITSVIYYHSDANGYQFVADLFQGPGTEAATGFQWVYANATNLTENEYYQLAVDVRVDGDHVYNESRSQMSYGGNSTLTTNGGWEVDQYDCYVEIDVGLFNETGVEMDSLSFNLSAPCEDPPGTDLTEVWLHQSYWLWCDGINVDLMSEEGPEQLNSSYECDDGSYSDAFHLFIETANLSEDDYYPMVWLFVEVIASGPDGNDTLVDDFVLLKDGQGNVDENYSTDLWQVSPYHCGVELYVGLYSNWTDDGAWPIES